MIYDGLLDFHFETGTEGLLWVLYEGGVEGYDTMRLIKAGDHLQIFGDDGAIVWEGRIEKDNEIGWTEFPKNPGHGQQAALGYWIHWVQKGFQPDDWARFFVREKGQHRYLGRLTKFDD